MKRLLKIEQFIKEALSLDYAKEYTEFGKDRSDKIKEKLNELFGGKQRIYLPVEGSDFFVKSDVYRKIRNILSMAKYDFDYIDGYAWDRDKPKNKIRILKVLTKLSLSNDFLKGELPEISKAYINDPARDLKNSKTNMVVLSQHPYDIAGMSTGRGWTSCMNLDTGCNRRYVEEDVKGGVFIAYFTNSNDTNIEKPFGRVLIKPYVKDGWSSSIYDSRSYDNVYFLPNISAYGSFTSEGSEVVNKWLEEKQGLVPRGNYYLPDELYADDGSPRQIVYGTKENSIDGWDTWYNDGGYDENGYNEDGYDEDGYNEEGYDYDGYDKYGYDEDGYDSNGYNEEGYDEYGYDEYGYNEDGYDSNGYDQDGYNEDGYNEEGYDKYGYNEDGYNEDGYDENGYDENGYDENGYDEDGYNEDGYNEDGEDRDGNSE